MTMGFTGVVWFPRGATWNSTALNAGPGPAPLAAAGAAWSAIATGLTDATATVTKVMAELRVGWEGVASDAALSKLAPFQAWTQQAAVLAAETAAKAGAQATAHTVARATMPSLAEIAAVKAAQVAAHTVGGSLAGAGAATEAADRALDLRAALVMEAYESASNSVAVPQGFAPPPPLAGGTVAAPAEPARAAVPQGPALTDVAVTPAQAVLGAVLTQAQNPAVAATASHLGTIAGTAVGAVAGPTASMASAAAPVFGGAAFGGAAFGGMGAGGAAGAMSPRTGGGPRPVGSVAAAGVTGGGAARITLPDGWGARGSEAQAVAGRGTAALAAPGVEPVAAPAAGDAAARTGPVGAPVGAGTGRATDDEEHRTPDYLKSFEHFDDGRLVIPSVIGGDR
ncbi:PPE domain-containing protein [Rhodococcus sp. NPDC058505]|uniref:PPE domain-containing protein n=1 Tax=unclassified Rhodococcus (in: high G+C Gram-positive bacteria) TaxID=192944 RepID=UPI00366414E6